MEWNIMEPGDSGASGIGCVIDDMYIPSDDCEDVLDEIIENLSKEEAKLRNVRRKLAFDKIIDKDLVPLIKTCVDEDIFARAIRLLANLSQPLDIFLQFGVSLGQQCQRDIAALVDNAKACCSDIEFFKSLHARMTQTLKKSGNLKTSDIQMLNHCLLLLRNLLHTNVPVSLEQVSVNSVAITQQSLLSSFFLSEMDKVILQLLHHPQKEEWVVSIVQLLSLIFKDYAEVLLDGEFDDEESEDDVRSCSDIFEFLPSHNSADLPKHFDEQLQLSSHCFTDLAHTSSCDNHSINEKTPDSNNCSDSGLPSSSDDRKEKDMQLDEEDRSYVKSQSSSLPKNCEKTCDRDEEDMSEEDSAEKENGKSELKHPRNRTILKDMQKAARDSTDDGIILEDEEAEDDIGKNIVEASSMIWENFQKLQATEKEIASELNSGSCLMDVDIIISYLKQFASEIICSGLCNIVKCLMKILLSTSEEVLDDSFFMWIIGFFLSYARHIHLDFGYYQDILNLDVFGFLVYEGFRNCELLVVQHRKQETSALAKYRLHLVVCTLNQIFQVILANKDDMKEGSYLYTVQKCLAQMGDLQRLFILLIRLYQLPLQDMAYLRDLIHTNHIFLLLLEDWASRGFIPPRFSMLSHIQQFASLEIMHTFGTLLEQYGLNKENLNVAILTMMYHVAGDCDRADVLLQLPILKTFSEIWGDSTCTKYAEFNDLIEYILESFMTLAFEDPNKCAHQLFGLPSKDGEAVKRANADWKEDKERTPVSSGFGVLSSEDQDLLFTWMTELQDSLNMVDDLVERLQSHGSSATRQQVMMHLLRNGWLEDKQLEHLSDEIKELKKKEVSEIPSQEKVLSEVSSLENSKLFPFLLEKIKVAGFESQLCWLQEQLLEAAYVRLGVLDGKYRIHVEEPLARFYTLQDKSIPLVTINEEQERAMSNPYFNVLLQSLGLFPPDGANYLFCRIPNFLTPAQLIRKAQQIGSIDTNFLKFDPEEVEDDPSYTEFTPLFGDHSGSESNEPQSSNDTDFRISVKQQSHQWLNFVCYLSELKGASS